MDITFEEYDNILKKFQTCDFSFEGMDMSRLQNPIRILNKSKGLEFLICALEYGNFQTREELKVKRKINELLIQELNFVDEKEDDTK